MLRYFEYLLFLCLNYQPILATVSFLYPFSRGVEKEHLPEIGQQDSSCFAFLFPFCILLCFFLSILKGPTLPWNKVISRLFHLNEICDSIVSEQVSFRSRYQNVSGKSQKKEKVRLSVYYDNHMNIICYDNHMLFFEKQNAFVQHLSCLTNDGLSLNANTIADASKTQSKYAYVTRVSVRLSIRFNITSKMTLAPQ